MAKSTRESLSTRIASKLPQPEPAKDAEQVTQRVDGDLVEARSTSRVIRTVEDLLRHIEADMSRYEVAASEATKWECASVDKATGQPVVTELFRVFVRLKPKPGPTVRECVQTMIASASRGIRLPAKPRHKPAAKASSWAVLVVADCHFGKYAWRRSTGQSDYDLDIADRLVREASAELLEEASRYKPARMTVAYLGDLFHYDTPHGTTTSGTPLERDGRIQKMIDVGVDCLLGVADHAATIAPADAVVVSGNHDETLTWAFHRILRERFSADKRLIVDGGYTSRKYTSYGSTLLGFAHGVRDRKSLPQLMAIETPADWGRCSYREIHTGHLHHQRAHRKQVVDKDYIDTIDGVVVRVAPAICPPDEWHASAGFVGSRQAMELFVYGRDGGLVAMHVAGPRIGGTE